MKDFIPLQFPVTLGGDIAGVVTEVGVGVSGVTVGDKVYGQANAVAGNSGAFAQFAATAAGQVAAAPTNLSPAEAASLPLVGVSALQAVTEHIGLQAGQKIFVNGAGGIGAIAIMIAKNIGAYVATTATGDGLEEVKKLGADEVIDFKSQDFAEVLKDYDAVFDTVGNDFSKTLTILKKGGIAVTMGMGADPAKAAELGVTVIGQSTKVTTAALNELTKLIEAGVVVPQVAKTFTLDQIVEAFTAREDGSVRGKVVINI